MIHVRIAHSAGWYPFKSKLFQHWPCPLQIKCILKKFFFKIIKTTTVALNCINICDARTHDKKPHVSHDKFTQREREGKMHSLHKLFEFFRLICIWQTLADKKSTIVQRTTCKDKWTFAEIVKWDQFISASFHVVFSTRTIWSGDFFFK